MWSWIIRSNIWKDHHNITARVWGWIGKKAHERQRNLIDDGSGQQFSLKAKCMKDFMKTKAEKKMKFDEIMLRGTSNS